MLAFFVEAHDAPSEPGQTAMDVTSLAPSPDSLMKPVRNPDVSPPTVLVDADDTVDDPTSPASEAAGDQAGHALMFGRYMGQITARIERAWMRPRTAIGADTFACRVRIVQDRTGNVKEVELRQCNGDTRWQMSLVHAIQMASPLPAPPDPSVFTTTVTLELDSQPFVPGGPQDGFEPVTLTAMESSANAQ